MGNVPQHPHLPGRHKDLKEWAKEFSAAVESSFEEVYDILRNIDFTENFDGYVYDTTTHATPDTEFSIAHNLDRVPTQYVVLSIDKACSIYLGTTAWTTTTAYFRCDIGTVALKVGIF